MSGQAGALIETRVLPAVQQAVAFWCDHDAVSPLTQQHLAEEIVRRLSEAGLQIVSAAGEA